MTFWERAGFHPELQTRFKPELILRRSEQQEAPDLIQAQAAMLVNNAIPGVVPFRLERADGRQSFHYALSGLKRWSRMVQSAPSIRHAQWENILVALQNTISRGQDFLLQENGFVLHPEWIFAAEDLVDLRLLYIPSRTFTAKEHRWNQWSLLHRFLEQNGLPEPLLSAMRPEQWEKETFDYGLCFEQLAASKVNNLQKEASLKNQILDVGFGDVIGEPVSRADDGDTMKFSKRTFKTKEIAAGMIALLGWGSFFLFKSEAWFAIACAASVPLGVVFWPWGKEDRQKKFAEELVWNGVEAEPVIREDYHDTAGWKALVDRTVLLARPEETQLLSEHNLNEDAYKTYKINPGLEVILEETGQCTLVTVKDSPFAIGRGPENVHFMIEHAAVSRRHLEIRRSDEGYEIRDAGSMNGSFKNEQQLPSLMWVPLEFEDVLQIPGATIVFKPHGAPA